MRPLATTTMSQPEWSVSSAVIRMVESRLRGEDRTDAGGLHGRRTREPEPRGIERPRAERPNRELPPPTSMAARTVTRPTRLNQTTHPQPLPPRMVAQ